MVSLDRFVWTPRGIGPECPRCVLDEWAETLGIQPALFTTTQLVSLIHENNRRLASTALPATGPATPEHWSRFAQFINPRCKWTASALNQVWVRLALTLRDGPAVVPEGEVGWPTPRSTRRIPATLAYGALVHRGLYVPPTATPAQLAELLHLSRAPLGEAGLRRAVLTLLHAHPTAALSTWSFLKEQSRALLTERYEPGPDQGERLRALFQRWERHLPQIERYEPRTHDEAVLFAAMQYGVDLHEAGNPLDEYTRLVLSIAEHAGRSRGQLWGCVQYVHPSDPALQAWTARCPSALSLGQTYRPVFPVEIWPHYAARDLAERWGKGADNDSHLMTVGEFLQWRAVALRFFAGHPKAPLNSQTCIYLTDVAAVPPADALAFGNDDVGYSVLAWQELQAWFEQSGQATWPIPVNGRASAIDACALAQLDRLAQDRQWFPLVQAIRTLKEEMSEERTALKRFVTQYYHAPAAEKQAIDCVLWTWLYLGMAMRGWTAEPPPVAEGISKAALYVATPFPLHDTAVEPGDTLDFRVHRWVALLYDAVKACSPAWQPTLLGLRLFLYLDGQYTAAHDRDQGTTLEERLRLLTRTENVFSCLRLSSNWMCSSAYYYLSEVGNQLPFAIRDLVRIG